MHLSRDYRAQFSFSAVNRVVAQQYLAAVLLRELKVENSAQIVADAPAIKCVAESPRRNA